MISDELFQEALTTATDAYVKNAGVGSIPMGFDPTIILTIFTTLLGLCKQSGQKIKDACTSPSIVQKFVTQNTVRRELRERYGWGAYQQYNGDAIMKTVFDVGSAADPAKIEALAQASL